LDDRAVDMKVTGMESRRLARLTKICLALPESTSEGEQHTAFLVKGKTYANHLVAPKRLAKLLD
jgi:hypothetical protein